LGAGAGTPDEERTVSADRRPGGHAGHGQETPEGVLGPETQEGLSRICSPRVRASRGPAGTASVSRRGGSAHDAVAARRSLCAWGRGARRRTRPAEEGLLRTRW
jgi:hypothetical protein